MKAKAKRETNDRYAVKRQIWSLIIALFLQLLVVTVILLVLFRTFSEKYTKVSNNITTVSQFNQNFKNDIDLKMYSFVNGSTDELPLDEVEEAKKMAEALLKTTKNKESHRAINSVLNLSETLSDYIIELADTEGYDQRRTQLENNIYVNTQLFRNYMYTYLYHEAGELARIQNNINKWFPLTAIALCVLLMLVVLNSLNKGIELSRSISQPIDELYNRVQQIGQGDWEPKPPVQARDSKLQALSDGLEEMVIKLGDQAEQNQAEQERLRSMSLSLLQAQINPHFLYNTLDAMIWLIETGKNDEAVEMVSNLSTYFRSFLSNGKDIITLREEEMHVRSYLQIQKVRYKDVLNYTIDLNPALGNCRIPKMTLQPLVENAIYHGIKPKRGSGVINIRSRLDAGYVHLTVSDSGIGMSPETLNRIQTTMDTTEASSFGIFASYQRLKLLFDNDFSFDIESTEKVGTIVHIRMPYTTEQTEALE